MLTTMATDSARMFEVDTKNDGDGAYGSDPNHPGTPSQRELDEKARQLKAWEENIRRQQEDLIEERRRMNQGGHGDAASASYPSTPSGGNNDDLNGAGGSSKEPSSKQEEPSRPQDNPIMTPSSFHQVRNFSSFCPILFLLLTFDTCVLNISSAFG
jgi:hypothetical protein